MLFQSVDWGIIVLGLMDYFETRFSLWLTHCLSFLLCLIIELMFIKVLLSRFIHFLSKYFRLTNIYDIFSNLFRLNCWLKILAFVLSLHTYVFLNFLVFLVWLFDFLPYLCFLLLLYCWIWLFQVRRNVSWLSWWYLYLLRLADWRRWSYFLFRLLSFLFVSSVRCLTCLVTNFRLFFGCSDS